MSVVSFPPTIDKSVDYEKKKMKKFGFQDNLIADSMANFNTIEFNFTRLYKHGTSSYFSYTTRKLIIYVYAIGWLFSLNHS